MAGNNAALGLLNQCVKVNAESVFDSISARDTYYGNNQSELKVGNYCIAANNLYQYASNGWESRTPVWKGAKGDTGDKGNTPVFTIGTVTSGETPSVSTSGTSDQVVLNFTLQKGDKGDTGSVVVTKDDVGLGNVTNDAQVKRSEMNVANGVETLDLSGKLTHMPTKSDIGLGNVTNDSQVKRGEMGVANGVETLTSNEKLTHMPTKSDIGLSSVTNDPQVKRSEMGIASGVETLTSDGKLTHMPTASDVGLGNLTNEAQIPLSQKGMANGITPLNADGKIDITYFNVNCSKIVGVTNSVARLALPAYDGFMVAVEADTKLAYGLNAKLDPSVSANWLPMGDVSSKVESINDKTGAVTLAKSDVGLGNVDNTTDSDKNVLSATKLYTARKINDVSFDGTTDITIDDSTKEPIVTAGIISQYYRGDKSWKTLNKAAVGLSNVDNTSDADKPISVAQAAVNVQKLNIIDCPTVIDWGANMVVRAGEIRRCTTSYGLFLEGQLIRSKEARTTGTIFGVAESVEWEPVGGLIAGETTPLMDGTATSGTSKKYSKEDHKHPSDTSKVSTATTVNGHALSGNVSVTAADVGLGNVNNVADIYNTNGNEYLTPKFWNGKPVYRKCSTKVLGSTIGGYYTGISLPSGAVLIMAMMTIKRNDGVIFTFTSSPDMQVYVNTANNELDVYMQNTNYAGMTFTAWMEYTKS